MSFNSEWNRATKKIKKDNEKLLKKIAIKFLSSIVDKTTVGNPNQWKSQPPRGYIPGKLKGNWVASLGAKRFVRDDAARDAQGSRTKAKLRKVVSGLKMNKNLWFTNAQPYARSVEDGSRINRPAGMVKRSIAGIKQLINRAIRG